MFLVLTFFLSPSKKSTLNVSGRILEAISLSKSSAEISSNYLSL